MASYLPVYFALALLIVDDKRSGSFTFPYLFALLLFGIMQLTMNFAGGWSWWQHLLDRLQG